MELNNVPKEGQFGNVVDVINSNFQVMRVTVGELENETTRFHGLFVTSTALSAEIPNPVVGDWALVGSGFPATIYNCQTAGTWTNTESTYSGGSPDLTAYLPKTDFNTFKQDVVHAVPLSGSVALSGISIVVLTQAAYDALVTKDSHTLYFITA